METKVLIPCIPLFGILTSGENEESSKEEECHFCLEKVQDNEVYIMTTPCCHHLIHCSCFREWAENHMNCLYCRTEINMKEFCILCLHKWTEDGRIREMSCCGRLIHQDCLETFNKLLTSLPDMTGYHCGYVVNCNQIILKLKQKKWKKWHRKECHRKKWHREFSHGGKNGTRTFLNVLTKR